MVLFACARLVAQQDGPPGGFGGPPGGGRGGGGPGGGGPGGPGGMGQNTKLVKQFDKDGDKRLNAGERKAAREFLAQERASGRGGRGPGGRRGPGGGESSEPPKPGPKLSPADVKSGGDAPLYDVATLRTLFIEFESPEWEKELSDFNNTDVDVPAKLTVDGKTYTDVGVHFRGMSSYFMVGAGFKHSLNLSMDHANKDQNLGGYRTLNLLNSHEDPSLIRTVLALQVARDYVPAPKANFVRVVINGESWGVYVNAQQFNKEFIKESFGTTKGHRWKAPGSPNGRSSFAYLGDDPEAYKRAYSIKTKDDPKAWADLVHLCKVLNQTPPDQLEAALAPILDIDGTLKFLALENALINNDGYWLRTSDFNIYQDEKGRFHVIPHDQNETFAIPGGPGFGGGGGGPGGRGGGRGGGPGGPGGPGGGGGFGGPGGGPGGMIATRMLAEGDKDGNSKLSKDEMGALGAAWFAKLDTDKSGKVGQEQFVERFASLLPAPEGFGSGPGRGGPARFVGPGLFTAVDSDKDGSVTAAEMKATFEKWAGAWDSAKAGALDESALRGGLAEALPRPNFGGGGGGFGPPGGGPGGRGGGGGGSVNGVELDPFYAAKDEGKPLLSKLLAVPALRARYLGYVRDIADKWLDWNKLGPVATQYHNLIAADVRTDTRKLDPTEAFEKSLTETVRGSGMGPFGGSTIGLKEFADQRRAYLLKYTDKGATK